MCTSGRPLIKCYFNVPKLSFVVASFQGLHVPEWNVAGWVYRELPRSAEVQACRHAAGRWTPARLNHASVDAAGRHGERREDVLIGGQHECGIALPPRLSIL